MNKWYVYLIFLVSSKCSASIQTFNEPHHTHKSHSATFQSILYKVLLPVYIKEHQLCFERKIPLAPAMNSSLPSTGAQQLKLGVKTLSNKYHGYWTVRLKSIYIHNITLPLHVVDKKLSYNNGIQVRILLKEGTIDHIFSDNLLSKCKTLSNYLECYKHNQDDIDIDVSPISINTFKNFISLLETIYLLTDPQEIDSVNEQIEDKIATSGIKFVRALEYQYILNKLFTELDIYNLNESAIRNGINEIYDTQCFFKNLRSTAKVDQLFNILVDSPHLESPVLNRVIKLIKKQRFTYNGVDSDIDPVMYLLKKIDDFYNQLQHLISDYAKIIFCAAGPSIQRENIISHHQLDRSAFDRQKFKQYNTRGYFYLEHKKITASKLKLIFPDQTFFVPATFYIDYNKDMTKFIYVVGEYSDDCNHTFAILYDKTSEEHTILGKVLKLNSNKFLPLKISADGKYVCANFCGEYINAVGDTKIINIPNGTVISFIGEENRIAYKPHKSENNYSVAIYDIESNTSTTIDYVTSQASEIFNISYDNKQVVINMLPHRIFHNYGYYGHEEFGNQDFVCNTLGFSGSVESITFKENYFKILEEVKTLKCAGALKILLESGYFNGNCSLDEQTQEKLLDLIPQSILDLLEDTSGSWLNTLD